MAGSVAIALAAGTVCVPVMADVVVGASLLQHGDGVTRLVLPGGEFHSTSREVVDLRTIVVPGTTETVILWNEVDQGGVIPHYALSRDGQTLAGRVRETSYDMDLRYGRFDPLVDGEPAVHPLLRAPSSNEQYLVQFWAPPTDAMRAQIEALGGNVERYLAGGAGSHIVCMSPQVRDSVAVLPFVRWIGANHPAYRMDAAARKAVRQDIASVAPARWSINVYRQGAAQQDEVANLVRSLGGAVNMTQPDLFRMEAMLTPAQLLQVSHLNIVEFIDAWGGPGEVDMDIGRELMGTNFVQSGGLNFAGQGVRGEIFDTELCTTHTEWLNPPIIHSVGTSGSNHGTSCFGICFARGASPQYKGHMPQGQGIFYRGADSTQFGGTHRTRLQIAQEAVNPTGPYRSVFQTSSVGSTRTFFYTSISAEMDTVLFMTDYLHCQSQSNAGNQDSRPQAWAKNIVSGGAVQHRNTLSRSDDGVSGASTGPAQDGRIKPDLAGFYDGIATTAGCSYTASFSGTSGGTPMVCGTIGLFFQMWHEGVFAGHGGGSTVFESRAKLTTAKAAMINTAYRYPFNVLNRYRQGWGMPDLRKLYERRNKTIIVDGDASVAHAGVVSYTIEVAVGEPELNLTMVYIEPAGPLVNSQNRVNDLSLRVTSPSGTIYWGNHGLKTANVSSPGGASDTKDTVECVFIMNPPAGEWTVEVFGDEVVFDTDFTTPGTQALFSLWITGATVPAGCYADCDQNTGAGTLDIFDFLCFGNRFSTGDGYACDCDQSTGPGVCDIFDFLCYGNAFAGGCP